MKRNFTSRHYFKEIFRSFLLMSIVPFLLFTSIIIFVNHKQNVVEVDNTVQEVNRRTQLLFNEAITEYKSILEKVSKEDFVIEYLSGNLTDEELMSNITPYLIGNEDNIKLHVVSNDYTRNISTSNIPPEYVRPEYKDYIYTNEVKESEGPLVKESWIKTTSGRVPLSIISKVEDDQGQYGYIIIDVRRDKILDKISAFENNIHTIITNNQGIVILDSNYVTNEGKDIRAINFGENRNTTIFNEVFYGKELPYNVVSLLNVDNFSSVTINLFKIFFILIFIAFITSAILAHFQSKKIYRPIKSILNTMNEVEENPAIRMDEMTKHNEMNYIALEFNRMLDTIERLNKEIIENSERQSLSEIKALQAQISPHFLYNMLNEIKSLAKLNRNADVALFIEYLGKMLRRSIDNASKFVTLEEDYEFFVSYLELQKIRYENSFEYSIEIDDDAKSIRIPNLIIQPIIENAIVHGFSSLRKDQILQITAKVIDGDLCITVYDNGRGIDLDKVGYINDKEKQYKMYGSNGLENVQKRLIMTYGIKYGITIESKLNKYTLIKILIPNLEVGK